MKYTIITLFTSLIVLLCTNLYGQDKTFLKYYYLVNKAELLIIDGNYKAANRTYNVAFKQVEKPFARDYWNALICSNKINTKRKSFRLIKKLALKGFEIKNFNTESFANFKNKRLWKKVEKKYDKWLDLHNRAIDTDLKEKMYSLQYSDQNIRYRYEIYKDSIRKVDSFIIKELIEIFDKKGIIDENDIGINNPNTYLPHYTLIRHHVLSYLMPRLGESLEKAVLDGRFSRKFYAMNFSTDMDGIIFGKNYGNMAIVKIDGLLYHIDYSKEELEIINKNRESIGLESYNEYVKKVDFAQENREFAFDNWAGFVAMNFADDRSKQIYLHGNIDYKPTNLIPISLKSKK